MSQDCRRWVTTRTEEGIWACSPGRSGRDFADLADRPRPRIDCRILLIKSMIRALLSRRRLEASGSITPIYSLRLCECEPGSECAIPSLSRERRVHTLTPSPTTTQPLAAPTNSLTPICGLSPGWPSFSSALACLCSTPRSSARATRHCAAESERRSSARSLACTARIGRRLYSGR